MATWPEFYRNIETAVAQLDVTTPWFRGHATGSWKLLPGLARVSPSQLAQFESPTVHTLEQNVYFDFVAAGGDLIPRTNDSWDDLFLIQHHGLPTRLLDWTESFAIALFFALLDGKRNRPCIWLLNPYSLGADTTGKAEIWDVPDLEFSYNDYFLRKTRTFPADVLAVRPRRHVRRIGQQLSAFTLHQDLSKPLNKLHPDCLQRFPIPTRAIEGAWKFLQLAGVSEYTLFPDLDGLARHFKRIYKL